MGGMGMQPQGMMQPQQGMGMQPQGMMQPQQGMGMQPMRPQQSTNPFARQPAPGTMGAQMQGGMQQQMLPNLSQPAQSGQRITMPAGSLSAAPPPEPAQQQPQQQSGFGGLLMDAKADFHGLAGVDM